MFIRTTPTRNSTTGETYITHRLVESRRVGGKVRCTGSHSLDTVLQLRPPLVWHKPVGLRGVT